MATSRTQSAMTELIEASRRSRGESSTVSKAPVSFDPERIKSVSRLIVEQAEKAEEVKRSGGVAQVIAKINPKTWKSRGLFWLSQIGSFAEAMIKGKYSKIHAVRAYEMVQSIKV